MRACRRFKNTQAFLTDPEERGKRAFACLLSTRLRSAGSAPSCRLIGVNRKRLANRPNGEFDLNQK